MQTVVEYKTFHKKSSQEPSQRQREIVPNSDVLPSSTLIKIVIIARSGLQRSCLKRPQMVSSKGIFSLVCCKHSQVDKSNLQSSQHHSKLHRFCYRRHVISRTFKYFSYIREPLFVGPLGKL